MKFHTVVWNNHSATFKLSRFRKYLDNNKESQMQSEKQPREVKNLSVLILFLGELHRTLYKPRIWSK